MPFQKGNQLAVGKGRPRVPVKIDKLRELARADEDEAYAVVRKILLDDEAPMHVRLAAADMLTTWARGRTAPASPVYEPISLVDLDTEESSIEAIKAITLAAIEARIPSDHAHRLMQLVSAHIAARRTQIEGQFAVAFAQMQAVMEGRAAPQVTDETTTENPTDA